MDDIQWPLQRCSSCQLSCYVQSYFTWSINNNSAIKIKSLTNRGRGLQMTLINDKFERKRVVKLSCPTSDMTDYMPERTFF